MACCCCQCACHVRIRTGDYVSWVSAGAATRGVGIVLPTPFWARTHGKSGHKLRYVMVKSCDGSLVTWNIYEHNLTKISKKEAGYGR